MSSTLWRVPIPNKNNQAPADYEQPTAAERKAAADFNSEYQQRLYDKLARGGRRADGRSD